MSIQLRLIAAAVTAAAAALTMGQASAQSYGNNNGYHNGYGHARIVRCESRGSRRTYCRVDTNGGNVRISRQLSRTSCIEGRNWGSNDRGIWVSNGCRANFAISRDYGRHNDYTDRGYYNHGDNGDNGDHGDRGGDTRYPVGDSHYVDSNGQIVHCDSTGDGRTYCTTEPNRRFQLSHAREGNCVEGQTWGMDDRGLWVSGGCRGDFGYQH